MSEANKKLYDKILNSVDLSVEHIPDLNVLGYPMYGSIVGSSIKHGSNNVSSVKQCEDTIFIPDQFELATSVLIIGGGAGGGTGIGGGGGGAGGYRTFTKKYYINSNYTVTVGAGGSAGSNGSNSSIERIASGGGAGGDISSTTGHDGGSGGGGGGVFTGYKGSTTSPRCNGAAQGNNGNDSGGGGGAGATPTGKDGGSGTASSITGSSVTRAGGGGGGDTEGGYGSTPVPGSGGSGGGGDGGTGNTSDNSSQAAGANGTVNTGSGGGGGAYYSDGGGSNLSGAGGNGGSGFVVIKIPATYTLTVGSGLTYTQSTSNGYTTYQFTAGTDTIQFIQQTSGFSFTQLGSNLEGESSGDDFGEFVSISNDGTRLAVGAKDDDAAGSDAGHVRIFEWDGSSWNQLGADIDGDGSSDEAGLPVKLSGDGNSVLISAKDYDGTEGSNTGHIRLYTWDGSAWNLRQEVEGEDNSDLFADSIDMSHDGTVIIAGCRNGEHTTGVGGVNTGYVRTFSGLPTSLVERPRLTGVNTGDRFGQSVACSADGNRVLIGSTRYPGLSIKNGRIQAFDYVASGSGSYVQVGSDLTPEVSGQQYGFSIAMNDAGTRIVAGELIDTSAEITKIKVFEYTNSSWEQIGGDIIPATGRDYFGYGLGSISMNGDGRIITVSAPNNDESPTGSGNKTRSGRVLVYKQIQGSGWQQIGSPIDGGFNSDYMGKCVSIDQLGNNFAIGADGAGTGGQAYVFGEVEHSGYSISLVSDGSSSTQYYAEVQLPTMPPAGSGYKLEMAGTESAGGGPVFSGVVFAVVNPTNNVNYYVDTQSAVYNNTSDNGPQNMNMYVKYISADNRLRIGANGDNGATNVSVTITAIDQYYNAASLSSNTLTGIVIDEDG